jgi:hypothetical protein
MKCPRHKHCVQSSTATVVWFHFRWAKKDVRTREVGTFCVPIWYISSFYWFCIYINMFPTFVTILPLTIPANYRLSSQFLWVGLKMFFFISTRRVMPKDNRCPWLRLYWISQYIPYRTLLHYQTVANKYFCINQTRIPTFKPTHKNWDDKR